MWNNRIQKLRRIWFCYCYDFSFWSASHVFLVSGETNQLIVLMFRFVSHAAAVCWFQRFSEATPTSARRLRDSERETGYCLMFTHQILLIASEPLDTLKDCFLFLLHFCFCSSSSVSAKTFTHINRVWLLSLLLFKLWRIWIGFGPNEKKLWCEHFVFNCICLYTRWLHLGSVWFCLFSVDYCETSW